MHLGLRSSSTTLARRPSFVWRAPAPALGDEAALWKSTVRRVSGQVKDEFATFTTRDRSGLRLDYHFVDGTN